VVTIVFKGLLPQRLLDLKSMLFLYVSHVKKTECTAIILAMMTMGKYSECRVLKFNQRNSGL